MSQCWTCSHVGTHATAPPDGVGVCRKCNGLSCSGHGVVDYRLHYFVCFVCVAKAVAGPRSGGGPPGSSGPGPGAPPAPTGGGEGGGGAAEPLAGRADAGPAEIALRYRGLVARAREVLPRAPGVRDAVRTLAELRSLLRDGSPLWLGEGWRVDWALALGLAA